MVARVARLTYCSHCGAPLPHALPVACSACGTRHWRNPKPAAAALAVRDGALLLVRRAHDPWYGRWCAPSGFCDRDEHPIAAAERETLEETGIAVEVTGYLGTWLSYYAEDDASGNGDDDEVVAVAYYHAVPVRGESGPFDRAEVTDARWFAPDEIPENVAPPNAFPAVLGAWRAACAAGETVTPLRDRPRRHAAPRRS